MNPRIWRPYAFVFWSLTAVPLPAQTVIVRRSASIPASSISAAGVIEEPDESTDQEPMEVEEAPQEAEPAKGKKEEKPTPRGERMKRNNYDRRPSTILKVWSTPVKPPETTAANTASDAEAVEPQPKEPAAPAEGAPAAETEKAAVEKAAVEKAAASKARNKAKEEAAKKKAEAAAIENEALAMQRMVTLGDWVGIKSYLAGLTSKADKKVIYEHLLTALIRGPQQRPEVPPQGQRYIEKNRFDPADILGLAEASALELTKEQLAQLGTLLRLSLEQGNQLDTLLAGLRPRMTEAQFVLQRRPLARVLAAAGELVAMGEFLPSVDEAEKSNDREGLNLLARHLLAQNAKDGKIEWLEGAWKVTQAALAAGDVDEKEKQEALSRAVDLAPRISKELGQKWLDESFTARPERGMEILASIGGSTSTALAAKAPQPEERKKLLELQVTAAKALLTAAPERAQSWARELSLLANNWLREALVTYQFDKSNSLGPKMQRDTYGNFYFFDEEYQNRGNAPSPLKPGEILELRPSDVWLDLVEESLRPKYHMVFAQLYLKVGEEAKAFPYIEALAKVHPKPAKQLVDEFFRVWAKNHNPDQNQNRNQYVYFYGFEERANSIPLTRSKQERNLEELGQWVQRLKALPIEDIVDPKLLAQAFTAAHSKAEVYRLETIERIFGSMKALDPETLATLMEQMRTNLLNIWNDPAVQRDAKTKRNKQDIEVEVLRGYELAQATLSSALAQHSSSWQLALADAALRHDENDYRKELKKDAGFSERRQDALNRFAAAAELYRVRAETLPQEQESADVYVTWFYAALGAVDLRAINHERVAADREFPRIKAALAAIPGEKGERHLAIFTNTLFTRMGNANPAVKFRYVREGLGICGDHDLASDARKLYDYYKDLVTEIRLVASIDGSDRVGHDESFGLRVDIRHTKEIERESGGFGKYLQNQNALNFSFNYGRPTEDYRDKFEQAAREALKENFEVLSVTFNSPETKSVAASEYGWRTTHYAYLLLKPRGPQVDRIPSLRLDLDFLDTSGYAVLPIETPIVALDCTAPRGEPRPFEGLQLSQTLDERQAKDGKLVMEVKARAIGLLPSFQDLVQFAPGDFEIVKRDDTSNSVVKFDDEGKGEGVQCERTFTLTLKGREGLAELPKEFAFPTPKVEGAKLENFRYEDADLASVGPVVALERQYGKQSRAWIWWTAGLALLAGGAFVAMRRNRPVETAGEGGVALPDELTPFTVLGFLRQIEANGVASDRRSALQAEIARLEEHYFGTSGGASPDLSRIAREWAAQTR
jgi:hypothetical protein